LLKNSFEEHPHHLTRRPFSEFLPPGHHRDTVDYQTFAIAFGVLIFRSRPAGLALTGLAVLIGFARVRTGVHYPSDILAAAPVAAIATAGVMEPGW
jgi:undecaprenyl-diphosphatase